MRSISPGICLILFALAFSSVAIAEDADEVREKGISALKDSQTNPHAIVDAARFFVKAAALYNAAGNEEMNVEMNSFLYWCKKKMTMADIEQFTKGGEEGVARKLAAVEKAAPKADDAQKWFDRADQFAKKNPDEHLLIAIRFFEVADRFKGSDASFAAQDRSLKEQLADKNSAVKTAVPPSTIKPAETAVNPIEMRPIPGADDIKMAEKFIKDLLKADYAKTDAPSRLALIAKLLQQADENKNEAALVYVCLHESRDLAVLVGDLTKAAEVQLRLSDSFKSDFAAILLDLKKLESSVKSAEPATALAALFAFEAEKALASADYDQAVRFNARAEDLLPLSKDAALKARLKTEIPRVQAIKRDSVAALAAQKTLATKPDDAEANLTAGKFALLLGEVEKSMALLAKSKDGVLSALAKRELAPPQDAAEQSLLADGWFDRAEKESNAYLKRHMQERAALWYASALPGLTGIAKLKVEARIKALPHVEVNSVVGTTAPINAAGRIVNVLDMIDPEKNTVSGKWKMLNGTLQCYEPGASSRLQFPIKPRGEYDLHFVLIPTSADPDGVGVILPCNNQQILMFITGFGNSKAGFQAINGKVDNGTAVPNSLKLESEYDIKIEVRKNSIKVTQNKNVLLNYHFTNEKFSIREEWGLNDTESVGLYVNTGTVRFDVIEYSELSSAISELPAKKPVIAPTTVSNGKEIVLNLGNGIKMEMVPIPAGSFVMGSPASEKGRGSGELQHQVKISKPFYMAKFLVTQEQYQAVTGENQSGANSAKKPVGQVSWDNAVQFCEKVSASTGHKLMLPTEAQWEYACRAGTRTKYNIGDSTAELAQAAWFKENSGIAPHDVGTKKPNAWGLYDMHGNVWEWCQDILGEYASGPQVDPVASQAAGDRVLRGGCFDNDATGCRSAERSHYGQAFGQMNIGFRPIMETDADPKKAAAEVSGPPTGRWISKDATYKLSSIAPDMPIPSPNLLNGKGGGYHNDGGPDDFAFSTDNDDDPWIVIDLKAVYDLQTIQIITRRSLLERAAPMIIYRGASAKGPWTEMWRTDERKAEYQVSISGKAQFIKILRTGKNFLNMFSIKVFAR